MKRWTRVAAYGLITDQDRILLCRLSSTQKDVGKWTLPGGGLDFGESPEDGAIREIREETGLEARITGHAGVDSKVFNVGDSLMHAVRIFYWAEVTGGTLCMEIDGSTDTCEWFSHEQALALPLVDIARQAVDLVFQQPGDAVKRPC